MRKLILLLILLALPAQAQVVKTTSGNAVLKASSNPLAIGPSSYVGPVATSTNIPNSLYTTASSSSMTRKAHYMRSSTTRVQLIYANWHVDTGTNLMGTEASTNNSITISSWVEYPVGTYTQVKFSGASSVTITDLTTQVSDFLTISIPRGALFYTWSYETPTTGSNMPYFYTSTETPLYTGNAVGEKAIFATSGVPTTPGAFSDNASGSRGYWPMAILGDTNQPTFCLIADSRGSGAYEKADGTLDIGNLARSIGPTNAYLNMGVSGDRMAAFFSSSTLRMALISSSGCTSIVNELGVNEYYQQGTSAAQWQAIQQTVTARFNGKQYARSTMEPGTSSTDTWATVGNQTLLAWSANETTSNDWVRTSADGVPYVELSTPVSSALDSGKWQANGTVSYYTNGGIHATTAGSYLIANAKTVNPRTLAANAPISVSYPSLTMTGTTPTYSTGKFGNAATPPTNGQAINVGIAPGVTPVTVECWVKTTNTPGANAPICGMGSGTSGNLIQMSGTNAYAGIKTGNGTSTFSTTAINDGVWHDLEMDIYIPSFGSNVSYYLYIDGVLGANFPYSFATTSTQYDNYLGVFIGGTGFVGAVDELSIWNTTRHTANFTPPSSAYLGTESGLVGLWHLDSDLTGTRGPAGL